jgi:5-methylcytosine-specific restriction endonuclease McrA
MRSPTVFSNRDLAMSTTEVEGHAGYSIGPPKRCTKCGEIQPLDQFHANPKGKDGLRSECKTCKNEYSRQWYEANSEKHRKSGRKWAAANRERMLETTRNATGRYRVRKSGGEIDESVTWLGVLEHDNWICGICHEAIDPFLNYPDPMSATVDHIIDVAVGGSHTWDNVQAAHLVCNQQKPSLAKKTGIIGDITVRIGADVAIRQSADGERTLVRWPS